MTREIWRRLRARWQARRYTVFAQWRKPYIRLLLHGPGVPQAYAVEPGKNLQDVRARLEKVSAALPTEFALWDAYTEDLVVFPGYLAAKMLRALPPC